ncbi:hypothetical protein AB0J21_22735 [Streptomyces sp. NPDC049954]|uniref:hypothetical protein n=1 Tax=Streptomyces sp. NPDC049954 TaxID=3155779 RepID=UPI00342F4C74
MTRSERDRRAQRRAREELRERLRERAHGERPSSGPSGPVRPAESVPGPVGEVSAPSSERDFPPEDLRVPPRDEVDGMLMRYSGPLVLDGAVRACRDCGGYRDWLVLLRQDNVWLRCPAGHTSFEAALDAVWFNRNSGPVDARHPSLEAGIDHLGG